VLLDQVGGVSRRRKERRRPFREVEEVADADREVRGVDEGAAACPESLRDPREVAVPPGRSADDRRPGGRERGEIRRSRSRVRELEDHVGFRQLLRGQRRASGVLARVQFPHDVVTAPGSHLFDLRAHLAGSDDAEAHKGKLSAFSYQPSARARLADG
jgi:hypothetical protein